MTKEQLRNRIVRAAVAWERARAENLNATGYAKRTLETEEKELSEAALAYTAALLDDAAPAPTAEVLTIDEHLRP